MGNPDSCCSAPHPHQTSPQFQESGQTPADALLSVRNASGSTLTLSFTAQLSWLLGDKVWAGRTA